MLKSNNDKSVNTASYMTISSALTNVSFPYSFTVVKNKNISK